MMILHVLQGPDRGMKFELPEDEPQLVGRSSEALPITDTTVSRRHAELTPDDGEWYLRDLDSANGTFINGQQIYTRMQLSAGDQIRCGSTLLVFALAADEEPRASRIRLIDPEDMDVTVEGTAEATDESMILASPDPVRAAQDHLRVIYDLTALTASTFHQDELLKKVMDLVFEEFSPDRGFVLLGDDPDSVMEPAVVRYMTVPKSLDEGRIPVSRTIIRHALEDREGVLSTNAMNDRRFRSGDSVRDYGIRSAICVPIASGDRTFGVLHIDSQLANFTFTESQLQLLSAIGRHTGLALLSTGLVQSKIQRERLAGIGQTVASLSHSIKNILQGLRGGADAVELALARGDSDLAREGWPILARNLDRIYTLTLNMLAYSRQPTPDIELADIHAVINEAMTMVAQAAERKKISLLSDPGEDVPPVPVDVNGLHQALVNLLMNAVDAVPPKKGVVTVATRYRPAQHLAEITVTDNGPGIPPERHEEVFLAFTSTKGQRGTGLGLAVARKIIGELGGTLELTSEVKAGATFTIELPAERADLDAADTSLPRAIPADELDEGF